MLFSDDIIITITHVTPDDGDFKLVVFNYMSRLVIPFLNLKSDNRV